MAATTATHVEVEMRTTTTAAASTTKEVGKDVVKVHVVKLLSTALALTLFVLLNTFFA